MQRNSKRTLVALAARGLDRADGVAGFLRLQPALAYKHGVRVWVWVVLIVGGILVWGGRAAFDANRARAAAFAAASNGHCGLAIAHAMACLEENSPLRQTTFDCAKLLENLAGDAERRQDFDTALVGWQALRGGLFRQAPVWPTLSDAADRADSAIARLVASRTPAMADRNVSEPTRRAQIEATFRRPARPNEYLAVLAVACALGFWVSIKASMKHRPAIVGAGAFLALFFGLIWSL